MTTQRHETGRTAGGRPAIGGSGWLRLSLTATIGAAGAAWLDAVLPNGPELLAIPLPVTLVTVTLTLVALAVLALARSRRTPSLRLPTLAASAVAGLGLLWVGAGIVFDLLRAVGLMPMPDQSLTAPPINWPGALTRLLAMVALAGLAIATSATINTVNAATAATTDRCARCGRPVAPAGGRPTVWLAVLAAAMSLPYLILKTHWSLGGQFGVNPNVRLDLDFMAGWGTIMLESVGTLGCVALALVAWWGAVVPRRLPLIGGRRVPRALVLVAGWIGSLILITTGLPGTVGMAMSWFTDTPADDALAFWVRPLVYGGWFVWGCTLAVALVVYARQTRPACPGHGPG